ncbi:MAG: recombinase RecA [Schleiferilactobacillus perolens]|uniref:Protein RecA n=1 Tax=Schleiferilactobacillus perolens DSM 12744 TaxID=1423792 RepID=A0A0R1NAI9_9LACO|nr:recombinase RecA [Schleiferilactobacillus perolens]KRL13432.1 protein RecA [Schleiferilactobacillus perolens DSM 12744]MCI2170249.1 recombinase RecA [Schleiferilactobacillus perolens]
MAKNTHPLKEVTEKTGKEERKVALADALKKIEKNFGKGAIMRMGEKADTQIKTVSTGSLALDTALGVGGYPRGRIVEIYGPESSGKTTVALHAVAEVQKEGGTAAYIDAENALDPEYAKHLGVNIDDLLLSQPDTGEQGLEIADALVTSGAVDLVVVDSVAALVPRAEIEGEMGDAHVGLQARLMSQALRKLSGSISKTKTIAIFINQIREKVGVMFGNPETTPGGRALKFYATIRLEVRRSEQIKDGTDIIGNRVKIKVVKNKVAPPFKVAEVDIMYGKGISRTGELLDMAVDKDIVDKSGSWYSYGADRIGQGRENAKQYLADHPDVESEIRIKVRQAYGISDAKDAEADQEKDAEAAKADAGKETTAAADKKAADAKAPATKPAAKASPDTKDVKETKDVKDTKDTKGKAKASAGEAIDIFDGSEK